MAKINILDSSVYNKISAGEVVDKPQSVVKELFENAIDSGATEIVVLIHNGGLSLIEVADNGSGIEKDDFERVFLPHATSKISDAKDLEQILSLGFRGEAMASIASVSMVTLESAISDGNAYKVTVEGGKIGEITMSSRAKGTTTTVKNLFFNTPARLKFMRKDKAEERDVVSIMEKLIFANPFIKFELYNEDKCLLKTRGEGLLEAIEGVYGNDISDHLLELNVEQYGIKMSGYISNTSYSKPTRTYQTFIVNNRVVTNTSLITALNKVYEDYFVKRTYPFAILSIIVDPAEIDVNVHPQKTEIRFEYQNKIYSFVQRNIKKRLEESLHDETIVFAKGLGVIEEEWTTPFNKSQEPVPSEDGYVDNELHAPINDFSVSNSHIDKEYQKAKRDAFNASFSALNDYSINLSGESETDNLSEAPSFFDEININIGGNNTQSEYRTFENVDAVQQRISEIPVQNLDYRIVGQLFGTYILLEYGDYIMLIDQHAAAEYTLYERLKKQIDNKKIEIQPLMLPIPIKLDNNSVSKFEENLDSIREIGIEVNKVSDLEYEITALPMLLIDLNIDKLIGYLFSDEDMSLTLKERLMYKACRSAIKGNTYLDNDQIDIFIKTLFTNGMHSKCPHGRPSYIKITKKELEKMFFRIV